jgi:SSS family solute:Na+ symporter
MAHYDIAAIDLIIVAVYLIFSRWLPLWLTRGKHDDAKGFFLGGRNFAWPLIGFSLFATNMSGSSFVGLAGAGYSSGIAVYSYEWMAAVILVFFIFFLLPFYLRSGVYTMPEFLEKRFDRRSRYTLAAVLLFFNIFVDCAAALYAGGLVTHILFPFIPIWGGVLFLAVLAGIMSIFGGLSAVVVSDTIQAVVLIIGGVIIFFAAWIAIPSWEAVIQAAPPGALNIIQPADDDVLPWPGLFTGVLIIGIYFWTSNQLIVQRTLGARSLDHGRWGALFAGFLKLPILFIMILPGTMAIVLYPDLPSPDMAFPTLAFDLLPIGLRGVILAALIAAITSSVDSILNSASTMVTMDFIKTHKPAISDHALVRIGQITTALVMIIAIAWAPQIQYFPSLWVYLQSVLSYVTPPIVAVFLTGIFWQRANRYAAFSTLIMGFIGGVTGFVMVEILEIVDIHFLYSAGISFASSVTLMILVSLLTKPEPTEKVASLIWHPSMWHDETIELKNKPAWQNYRYQSILLLLITALVVGWYW